jgi:hypothetical protein
LLHPVTANAARATASVSRLGRIHFIFVFIQFRFREFG